MFFKSTQTGLNEAIRAKINPWDAETDISGTQPIFGGFNAQGRDLAPTQIHFPHLWEI